MSVTTNIARTLVRWVDSDAPPKEGADLTSQKFEFIRCIPFLAMHLTLLFVIWVGWSPVAVWTAVVLYLVRMFAITGFYHRYFSHRSFKTNRFWQFVFAFLGCASVQRGPLWWAAHHRHHHKHTDTQFDTHSPTVKGFWWSHVGWFTCEANFATNYDKIKDFNKFPELRFMNRFDIVIPVIFAVMVWGFGVFLEAFYPELGTNGWQMLVWGFFISTIFLFHGTFTINSLAHVFGSRRYDTPDTSRNNFWLSLVTLGEGWHNNHHRYPNAARQGFYWWEIDITYYILKLMSYVGMVWDLREVPEEVREAR